MNESKRHELYPPVEPHQSGYLKVGESHEIYYEECGNADGKPVLVVHGGPGGGANRNMRRYHDPARYRIILFDQRGCGRSRPYASLEENTTWDLVDDMERLRRELGVDRWQLFGGSWGSTLSLVYAQRHPDWVSELVLRGIFTLRRKELEWFYQEGAGWIFPEAFEVFLSQIPESERTDVIAAYHRRLTDPSHEVQVAAARAWSTWEGSALSLYPDPGRVAAFGADQFALAIARIECHYFVNGGFFQSDNQVLEQVDRIAHIPGVIVQGRYDVVTPVRTAWQLSKAWPNADLRIVPDAGHAMSEPGIVHELVTATRRFAPSA